MLLPNTLVNYYFEKICEIPHLSYHEEKIANFILNEANKFNHFALKDEYNNVLVIIEPSKGYEKEDTLMFQAHIDMVGSKGKDSDFDFLNDSLKLRLNKNILMATDTTLGADDGVGVAIMLSFMANKTLKHPRLELLFTSMEEVGTDGAEKMDISKCNGKMMINLDGSGIDNITVGCFCSDKIIISKKIKKIEEKVETTEFKIKGFEAYKNHPLKEVLKVLNPYLNEINFVSLDCGFAENMPATEVDFALKAKKEIINKIKEELIKKYNVSVSSSFSNYYYENKTNFLIHNLVMQIKEGTLLEDKKHGMIATFLFGIMRIKNDILEVIGSNRCLNYKIKDEIEKDYQKLAFDNQCDFKAILRYKGWEYQKESKLKERYLKVLFDNYNVIPKEVICPGGLEVTDFLEKRKDLEILSLGANCGDFHTSNEWLDIDSLNLLYERLTKLIEEKHYEI